MKFRSWSTLSHYNNRWPPRPPYLPKSALLPTEPDLSPPVPVWQALHQPDLWRKYQLYQYHRASLSQQHHHRCHQYQPQEWQWPCSGPDAKDGAAGEHHHHHNISRRRHSRWGCSVPLPGLLLLFHSVDRLGRIPPGTGWYIFWLDLSEVYSCFFISWPEKQMRYDDWSLSFIRLSDCPSAFSFNISSAATVSHGSS